MLQTVVSRALEKGICYFIDTQCCSLINKPKPDVTLTLICFGRLIQQKAVTVFMYVLLFLRKSGNMEKICNAKCFLVLLLSESF